MAWLAAIPIAVVFVGILLGLLYDIDCLLEDRP